MTLSSHPIADQVYQITLSGLLTWDEFQTYLASPFKVLDNLLDNNAIFEIS